MALYGSHDPQCLDNSLSECKKEMSVRASSLESIQEPAKPPSRASVVKSLINPFRPEEFSGKHRVYFLVVAGSYGRMLETMATICINEGIF